jgi:hypothetical protein
MAEYNDPRARLDPHDALSAHAEAFFFSSPNIVLGVKVFVTAATAFVIVQIVRRAIQATPANPFARDERKQRKPYITPLLTRVMNLMLVCSTLATLESRQ